MQSLLEHFMHTGDDLFGYRIDYHFLGKVNDVPDFRFSVNIHVLANPEKSICLDRVNHVLCCFFDRVFSEGCRPFFENHV